MNKLFLFFAVCLCTILSCTPPSKEKSIDTTAALVADVPYLVANRYFVKNTFQKDQLKNPIITTQAAFDSIFGMATVMGKDGKPTPIDFDKQMVITQIMDETNKSTELIPEKLQVEGQNKLHFQFETKLGGELTMIIRPFLIIIVDKKYSDYKLDLSTHSVL